MGAGDGGQAWGVLRRGGAVSVLPVSNGGVIALFDGCCFGRRAGRDLASRELLERRAGPNGSIVNYVLGSEP